MSVWVRAAAAAASYEISIVVVSLARTSCFGPRSLSFSRPCSASTSSRASRRARAGTISRCGGSGYLRAPHSFLLDGLLEKGARFERSQGAGRVRKMSSSRSGAARKLYSSGCCMRCCASASPVSRAKRSQAPRRRGSTSGADPALACFSPPPHPRPPPLQPTCASQFRRVQLSPELAPLPEPPR